MAPSMLQSLDKQLDAFFGGWNVYSTVLAALIIAVLFYPLFFAGEADIHPYLLARQSVPAPVRQPGESAVHRSLETPHGYPLRGGLDVKDEGAPRWNPGRNGDLRDVWREALKNAAAKVIKVEGRLGAVTRGLPELSKEINIIGRRIQLEGGTRVATYLPNSPELLVTLFAGAFYGFTPILISPDQPVKQVADFLQRSAADILVVPAGTLSAADVKAATKLKHIIWVVEQTSRQVEWADSSSASEWHNLIGANIAETSADLPNTSFEHGPPGVAVVSQLGRSAYEVTEYSQGNLVAATAAQLTALPRSLRLSAADTFLPLVPLASSYPLCLALAALHSHSTLALTSSASQTAPLRLASQNPAVQPTVVLAPSAQLADTAAAAAAGSNLLVTLQRSSRTRNLAAGKMPFANVAAARGPRLLYTSAAAGGEEAPALTANELTALRLATGARVLHALTAARVAGAVAQSNALDYRADLGGGRAHFGPPPACLEVKLVADRSRGADIPDEGDNDPVGVIVARGPAVVGGEANLGAMGTFGADGTLRVV